MVATEKGYETASSLGYAAFARREITDVGLGQEAPRSQTLCVSFSSSVARVEEVSVTRRYVRGTSERTCAFENTWITAYTVV